MREEREAAVELGWVEGVEGDKARGSTPSSPRSRSFPSKYAYNKGYVERKIKERLNQTKVLLYTSRGVCTCLK